MDAAEYKKEFLSILKEHRPAKKQNYLGTKDGLLKEFYAEQMRRTDSIENLELLENYLRQKNVTIMTSKPKKEEGQKAFVEKGRKCFLDEDQPMFRSGLNNVESELIVDGILKKQKNKMREQRRMQRKFKFLTQPKNYLKKDKENVRCVDLQLKKKTGCKPVSNYKRKRKMAEPKSQRQLPVTFRRVKSQPRMRSTRIPVIKLHFLKNFVKSNYLTDTRS